MTHFPLESLVFVAYLDSLFTEGGTRDVAPLRSVPGTLNRLYLQAMRQHDRPAAVQVREDGAWRPMPDWRLDRHVIRLGLYLQERMGLEPGDRVALISELRPEWLVADFAALGLGAVSVAVDPRLGGEALHDVLEEAAPKVTFASEQALGLLSGLDGRAPTHGTLVALRASAAAPDAATLDAWLDLGGTLDTPERAQSFRARAREAEPGDPAIRHYRLAPAGWERLDLTQGEIAARLRAGWLREPARRGDVAYLSDPAVSPAARLALYGFLGDGYTTTALGAAGREAEDIAELRPAALVAPPELLARFGGRSRALRAALGGRMRRIGTTGALDPALARRLGTAASVEPASL